MYLVIAAVALAIVYVEIDPTKTFPIEEGKNLQIAIVNKLKENEKATVYARYTRCPKGGKPRGEAVTIIATNLTAQHEDPVWEIPWIDGLELEIVTKIFNPNGMASREKITYRVSPTKVHQAGDQTAIVVDLEHQRLYFKKDGEVTFMSLCSAGKGKRTRPGEYQVKFKARNRGTDFPGVTMPYCLGITPAGQKPRYRIHDLKGKKYLHLLGQRASLGCIRQDPADAKWLYQNIKVGTPVYIVN